MIQWCSGARLPVNWHPYRKLRTRVLKLMMTVMLYSLTLGLVGAVAGAAAMPTELRLPRVITSAMVLQAERRKSIPCQVARWQTLVCCMTDWLTE
jgi:hypothetical protein